MAKHTTARRKGAKPKRQIAALPFARGPDGAPRILVITSRETQRFIVPKGWPLKGVKDHRAAEIEAREEAGLIGRARAKPLGSFHAQKRRGQDVLPVRVKVFLFAADGQLDSWKEKGQREMAWLGVEEAATLLDERGLAELVPDLPKLLPKSWRSHAAPAFTVEPSTAPQPATISDTA